MIRQGSELGSERGFGSDPTSLGKRLNEILVSMGETGLPEELAQRFGAYAALLMRWNARMNLTAVRDEEGILRRHFAESILCARTLPGGISTLLDFGSGAGFPGIPIALCRPETAVVLGESQGKKTAFLQEAVRVLGLTAKVYSGRVETLSERFDCVALRAVDRMGEAVRVAAGMVGAGGLLAALTSVSERETVEGAAGAGFSWGASALPGSAGRILLLGRKA